jgi:arylsulfatase A-like enzyme
METKRPNIVLFMTDNQPADLLGCSGNEEIYTPNLDRMAHQGIRFSNTFCVNAMCSPCRASVFTGLMPSQHGIHTWIDDRAMDTWPKNWNALNEFRTLPEILTENGYKTAMVGKYHLGNPFKAQNGFQHWVTFPHGHTRNFWNNTIIDNGKQYTYPGHIIDCFTEKSVEYINGLDPHSEDPFFLFIPYNAPYGHWPSVKGPARNRFAKLYENAQMTSIPREGLSEKAILRFLMKREESAGGIDYSSHLRIPNDLISIRNYYSQMTMVDDGVGRVLSALQHRGMDDDTLIIYTADHGFSLGHNGYWGHGQATWPANAHRPSYHIPLLIRHTNHIRPLQVYASLTSQIDIFSTILDYVGLGDASGNENSPSRSFAPLLRGETYQSRDAVYMEQEETRAVRTAQWLYMRRFNGSGKYPMEDEMYDLSNDPHERINVLENNEHSDIATSLVDQVDSYFRDNSTEKFDLWKGGTIKSNTDKAYLWKDAWGESWQPVF